MSLSLFTRAEKQLLAALALIQFANIVDFMILMPLGPQLMRMFSITPQQFGWLVSSYTFAAGTTGFAAAFFVDRFDRKTSLLFFSIGFTLGTLACALAQGYHAFLLARTITGAFGGVLGSLVLAIVGDAIGPERRASATGLIMTAFSMASVLGVPFSLYLANHFGWHAPFFFLGLFSVGIVGLIAKAVPAQTGHLAGQMQGRWYAPVLSILKNRNQVLALVFQSLLIFGQFSIIPFLSPTMVANGGLSEAQLPLIYLTGGMISMVAGPLIGRLADLYGKKKIFLFGALISIIPIYLITHLHQSSVLVILSLVGFFFFCMSGRIVPAVALVTSTARPQIRGTFMSIVTSVQQFSAALAAATAGAIVVRGEGGRLENYGTVGWIAIGFSILAIIITRLLVPLEGDNR